MEHSGQTLLIFTTDYPFGTGEPFLEDELRVLAQLSARVTVISGERGAKTAKRYLPQGTQVVCSRMRRYAAGPLLEAVLRMLLPQTWREKRFAYRTLGYGRQKKTVNKQILIAYYISAVLKRTVRRLEIPHGAAAYAYWMSGEAFFLSEFKKVRPDVTCICRAHGSDCYIEKFYQPFRREILNGLDAVFPVSEAGKRSMETHLLPHAGGRPAPLSVSRLGILKASSALNPPERGDAFRIVTCSNVIPLKRLDLLIDALALLQGHDIHWTHFGDGVQMAEVRQRAAEKLQGGRITCEFAGQTAKEEILRQYETRHADLFVNCSDSEGIPVSVMEAFAFGIPAIARDVGGLRELVRTGQNGVLLPTECTPALLRDAIAGFMETEAAGIARLRAGAFETYLRDCRAEKNYREFYERLFQTARK